jgi:hypothetical protein
VTVVVAPGVCDVHIEEQIVKTLRTEVEELAVAWARILPNKGWLLYKRLSKERLHGSWIV